MAESKTEFSADRADWLVKARADTQCVTAKLYRLVTLNSKEDLERYGYSVQLLIGVSFALWRAAFYSDKSNAPEDTAKGGKKLLGEMLENNAISYSHEKETKDFTFNFYATNALYRLTDLDERWEGADLGPLRPPVGQRDGQTRWNFLNDAFGKAVDEFERRLKAAKAKRLGKDVKKPRRLTMRKATIARVLQTVR